MNIRRTKRDTRARLLWSLRSRKLSTLQEERKYLTRRSASNFPFSLYPLYTIRYEVNFFEYYSDAPFTTRCTQSRTRRTGLLSLIVRPL